MLKAVCVERKETFSIRIVYPSLYPDTDRASIEETVAVEGNGPWGVTWGAQHILALSTVPQLLPYIGEADRRTVTSDHFFAFILWHPIHTVEYMYTAAWHVGQ